jgi:hypothetical protein
MEFRAVDLWRDKDATIHRAAHNLLYVANKFQILHIVNLR